MSFVRAYKLEICIFALALLARLIFFGFSYAHHDWNLISSINSGDGYYDISYNLISGNGYSIDHQPPYTLTSFRTPGMPYFIALVHFIFGSYLAVILVHIVIGSIVPLLGMKIAQQITQIRAVIIGVGVFLALEPTGVLYSTVLLSEVLFTFLFAISLLCLFRYWRTKTLQSLLLCSFLLGISTLTRPPVEYLPIVIIALIVWEARADLSRTILFRCALFALVFLVTLSPWIYRNYVAFGAVGLSSQQGAALYAITVPSVLAIANGTSFSAEYNTDIAGPNETNFAQSVEYSKLAIPILLDHSRAFALLGLNTSVSFFTYDGVFDVLRHVGLDGDMYTTLSQAKIAAGIQPSDSTFLALLRSPIAMMNYLLILITTPLVLVFLGRVLWFVITIGFFFGIWRCLRHEEDKIYTLTAASIVIYLMLTTVFVGFTTNYRYRMPVNPIIFTFALYAIFAYAILLRDKFRSHSENVVTSKSLQEKSD